MRWLVLCSVRNPDEMTKIAIVSNEASCVNEWLVSGFPKGPFRNAAGLGSVDRQWGSTMGIQRGCTVVDSPSRVGAADAGGNVVVSCLWRWRCNRGNGEVLGERWCAFPQCGNVDMGGMAASIGGGFLACVGFV